MYGRKNTKKMQKFNYLTENLLVLIFEHRLTAWLVIFYSSAETEDYHFHFVSIDLVSTSLNAEQFREHKTFLISRLGGTSSTVHQIQLLKNHYHT